MEKLSIEIREDASAKAQDAVHDTHVNTCKNSTIVVNDLKDVRCDACSEDLTDDFSRVYNSEIEKN